PYTRSHAELRRLEPDEDLPARDGVGRRPDARDQAGALNKPACRRSKPARSIGTDLASLSRSGLSSSLVHTHDGFNLGDGTAAEHDFLPPSALAGTRDRHPIVGNSGGVRRLLAYRAAQC